MRSSNAAGNRVSLVMCGCLVILTALPSAAGTVLAYQEGTATMGEAWWFNGSSGTMTVGSILPEGYVRYSSPYILQSWSAGLGCVLAPVMGGDCYAAGFRWAGPDPHDGRITWDYSVANFGAVNVMWQELAQRDLSATGYHAPPAGPGDTTAPISTATFTGLRAPGSVWYETSGDLVLNATDSESGLGSLNPTLYRLGAESTWHPYTSPLTLTAEGIYDYRFLSVDQAGNFEAEQSELVQLDFAPPTLSDLLPTGTAYSYFYNFADSDWEFQVSGTVADTASAFVDLALTIDSESLRNVSGYKSSTNALTHGFTIDFTVIDPTQSSEARFSWTDLAGHSVNYDALASPEPGTTTLLGVGLFITLAAGRRHKRPTSSVSS